MLMGTEGFEPSFIALEAIVLAGLYYVPDDNEEKDDDI